MAPKFFNSLTRTVEPLVPLDPEGKVVKIYTCGPTVYNFAHIGNFRAYVFEDLLHRHLEYRGYSVRRVMNLTDVDDKTIRGCRDAGVELAVFTEPFKQAFFQDLDDLRIKRADEFPEATAANHIERMIEMIGILMEKGHAYRAEDGSVYFRIHSFPNYGRLAHLDLSELRPGARVQSDEYEKENIGDFALWKAWDEADGAVAWDSPWGRGRPGWHIECSAMATGLLGPQIDIHCGGEDNLFPHHEAEIAQSECVTGMPFVRLWMHCRHLMVDGRKMAKSEGNFYTLRDLKNLGWSGREVRYALLSVRYREPLNFTFDGLAAARSALVRLDEWSRRLAQATEGYSGSTESLPADLDTESFGMSLDDDLNISAALASVFDLIRESNRLMDLGKLSPGQALTLMNWLSGVQSVLALEPDAQSMTDDIRLMVEARAEARKNKNWAESDRLRDEIVSQGWDVKDTRDGQKITPRAHISHLPKS